VHFQISLIEVIEQEGIKLKKAGRAYKTLCPFHEDKNPSFYVYPDSNRFICYGCGERGDAIDFIMKLKRVSFKEALEYLGIEGNGKRSRTQVEQQNRRQELVQNFRRACCDYYDEICTEFRCINKVLRNVQTMQKAEELSTFYHRLPILEYHMDIMALGTDEERHELLKGIGYEF
jgi:hypothetical protein